MRLRLTLFVLSVAINIAFASLLVRSHWSPSARANQPPMAASPAASPSSAGPSGRAVAESPATSAPAPPAFSWSQLESEDYAEYIRRLRAFGVPERTIRDLLLADVEKMYRPKLAALRAKSPANTNFWEQRNRFGPSANLPKEQREQMNALQKEQRELVKTLLGKNVYAQMSSESGYPDWTERMFGPITGVQRDRVSEMQERFQQARSEIYERADGMFDMETQNEVKVLQRKFREDLATVLTPEQVEEYQLRSSDTANQLRVQLGSFEPNEQEFRAIFTYKQALEDLNPPRMPDDATPSLSSDQIRKRPEQQKDLEEGLADALGPDRLKEFKMMEQSEWRNLYESGVSREDILKVVDIKAQAEDAARKLRSDNGFSSDQRTQALQALRAETEKTLTDIIGDRRVKSYASRGGFWLQNIAPRDSSARVRTIIRP